VYARAGATSDHLSHQRPDEMDVHCTPRNEIIVHTLSVQISFSTPPISHGTFNVLRSYSCISCDRNLAISRRVHRRPRYRLFHSTLPYAAVTLTQNSFRHIEMRFNFTTSARPSERYPRWLSSASRLGGKRSVEKSLAITQLRASLARVDEARKEERASRSSESLCSLTLMDPSSFSLDIVTLSNEFAARSSASAASVPRLRRTPRRTIRREFDITRRDFLRPAPRRKL